jgi:Transglycosylase SLT domain
MRDRSIVTATVLAFTLPALVLAAGRASADEPSAGRAIPASAFHPVATRRPQPPVTDAPPPTELDVLVDVGPSPTPPPPRVAPAVPLPGRLVVPLATPKPVAATPSVADAKAYARSRIGSTQFTCLDALWTRESNWNPYARNSSSGAYGIPQALPGDKMATFGADWQTNPVTQVKWGLSYIAGRYGTACNAWSHSQTYGWY